MRDAWSLENPGNRAARAELTAALLGAAPLGEESRVLDCGCGTGWLLAELAAAGLRSEGLHGLDRDARRLEAARHRVPGARFVEADATSLPFDDESFEAVFFVVSLSSMGPGAAVRTALSEGRRVLAPGGVLVVYEPRLPNPFNPSTRRLRSADLRAAGIEPTDSRTLTLLPPLGRRLGRLSPRLHPALSRLRPLRSHRLTVHRQPGRAPTAPKPGRGWPRGSPAPRR